MPDTLFIGRFIVKKTIIMQLNNNQISVKFFGAEFVYARFRNRFREDVFLDIYL